MSIEAGKKHWAMIPPQVVPGAGIDSLIDKQLAEKKLVPNAPASRSALVRRLYLDLTELADGTFIAIWAQIKSSPGELYGDIHSARIVLRKRPQA